MTKEPIVRDIVGYEGLYSIDIFGNVIRLKDQKEMSTQTNVQGYVNVSLTKDKSKHNINCIGLLLKHLFLILKTKKKLII